MIICSMHFTFFVVLVLNSIVLALSWDFSYVLIDGVYSFFLRAHIYRIVCLFCWLLLQLWQLSTVTFQLMLILFIECISVSCMPRFNDHWRFATQRSCFLAAFTVYLESEQLISREDCTALIGGENGVFSV